MDHKELYLKYQALLAENVDLKTEIKRLKAQRGIPELRETISNEINKGI